MYAILVALCVRILIINIILRRIFSTLTFQRIGLFVVLQSSVSATVYAAEGIIQC